MEASTTVLYSDMEVGNIGSIGFQRKAKYVPLHTGPSIQVRNNLMRNTGHKNRRTLGYNLSNET